MWRIRVFSLARATWLVHGLNSVGRHGPKRVAQLARAAIEAPLALARAIAAATTVRRAILRARRTLHHVNHTIATQRASKSTQPKPAQASPSQPKPAQASPSQPKPVQASPSQPKPAQASPSQPKPAQASPSQPKPAQASPSQPKPESAQRCSQVSPSQLKPSHAGGGAYQIHERTARARPSALALACASHAQATCAHQTPLRARTPVSMELTRRVQTRLRACATGERVCDGGEGVGRGVRTSRTSVRTRVGALGRAAVGSHPQRVALAPSRRPPPHQPKGTCGGR
jgi:hypothetical protein